MERRVFERWLTESITRRRFLGTALVGAGAAVSLRGRPTRAAGSGTSRVVSRPRFAASPFQLGVASGDPLPDSVVIWTRLVADAANGSIGQDPIELQWEVATDTGFADVVQSGTAVADPALAHSVHVDVAGLESGSDYFYRFMVGNEETPVGRTRTAPAPNAPLDRFRFGFVSCANYEHGYFTAYRHLAADQPDVILALGDYIYEYGAGSADFSLPDGAVRNVTGDVAMTLDDYRMRHALYKTDLDLQQAHLAAPWIVTWDDHEVENDYASDVSPTGLSVEQMLERRSAAYQAYYEHMPLRPESMPRGPDARLYRRLAFGDLIEFNVLDTRQFRSPQLCGGVGPRCDAALDPSVTMTGPEQEQWLIEGLTGSSARWKTIAQQVMMTQLDVSLFSSAQEFNQDQWDGYPLARNRILGAVRDSGIDDVVTITGDIHSSWVADLKANFADDASPVVATEFVGPSITSYNPYAAVLGFALGGNPHIHYYDGQHGYCRVEVTPERWTTEYRALPSVTEPDQLAETIATWVVESGKPGAVAG